MALAGIVSYRLLNKGFEPVRCLSEVHAGVQPRGLQIEGILYNEAKQIFFEKLMAYNAAPACKTSMDSVFGLSSRVNDFCFQTDVRKCFTAPGRV